MERGNAGSAFQIGSSLIGLMKQPAPESGAGWTNENEGLKSAMGATEVDLPVDLADFFLEDRQTGPFVFAHHVAVWECIDGSFFGFTGEEKDPLLAAAFEDGDATVEDVSFTGFFADSGERHECEWVVEWIRSSNGRPTGSGGRAFA